MLLLCRPSSPAYCASASWRAWSPSAPTAGAPSTSEKEGEPRCFLLHHTWSFFQCSRFARICYLLGFPNLDLLSFVTDLFLDPFSFQIDITKSYFLVAKLTTEKICIGGNTQNCFVLLPVSSHTYLHVFKLVFVNSLSLSRIRIHKVRIQIWYGNTAVFLWHENWWMPCYI